MECTLDFDASIVRPTETVQVARGRDEYANFVWEAHLTDLFRHGNFAAHENVGDVLKQEPGEVHLEYGRGWISDIDADCHACLDRCAPGWFHLDFARQAEAW